MVDLNRQIAHINQTSRVFFCVKNDDVMSQVIKDQLFFRTFPTKGDGRGIGDIQYQTLTEQYFKGNVSFVSDEKNGTVLTIKLPLKI